MSAVTAIADWLASSITTRPVLSVTGPGRDDAILHLSRTVDVIHARPDALARGLTGTYGYGAAVIAAARLDPAATTGLATLMRRPVIRIMLTSTALPVLTGPDAGVVAARLHTVHLGGDGDGGDPLPRVTVRVDRDRAVRARDMRSLRALIPAGELHPDAVIRGIEVRGDGAYLTAELPLQLELFTNAQGPPPVGTGLSSALPNLRQETENGNHIIAHSAGDRAVS